MSWYYLRPPCPDTELREWIKRAQRELDRKDAALEEIRHTPCNCPGTCPRHIAEEARKDG